MLSILIDAVRDWVQSVLAAFYSMYLGYVTPQMFGAVGDGVHDDTLAIKRCLETNGMVYIPKGIYLVRRGQDITVSQNLCVMGAGTEQSIIRFYFSNNSQAHGMRLNANSNSFIVENVAFESIINDGNNVYIGNDDTVLMFIKGSVNEIAFKGCRFTSTGNANALPKDTLVWCLTSGKSLIIESCLFENFTNNQKGGCFWHRSYDDYSHETKYTETIICRNSEFRNTNSDEAFVIWDSKDNAQCGYHNVLVESNTFIHKNWNGECYSSSQIVNIASYLPTTQLSVINTKIAQNYFYVDKIFNTAVKLIGIEGAVCEGNRIHVATIANNTNGHSFIETRLAKATIKDNIFTSDINETFLDDKGNLRDKFVEIANQASDTLYVNNRFILKSYPRVNIAAETHRGKKDDSETAVRGDNFCTLDSNFIDFDKPNTGINIYITKEPNDGCTLIMKNNVTNAKSMYFSQIGASRIEVLNNSFSYRDNSLASFELLQSSNFGAGATLKFENNRNTRLILRNPTETKKLTSFTYGGLKSGIAIMNASDRTVEDYTSSNIKQYSSAYNLTYTDGYGWPTDVIVGRVDIMPPANQYRVGQTYVYGGTEPAYIRGETYECKKIQNSNPVAYSWQPLSEDDLTDIDFTSDTPIEDYDPTSDIDFNTFN